MSQKKPPFSTFSVPFALFVKFLQSAHVLYSALEVKSKNKILWCLLFDSWYETWSVAILLQRRRRPGKLSWNFGEQKVVFLVFIGDWSLKLYVNNLVRL